MADRRLEYEVAVESTGATDAPEKAASGIERLGAIARKVIAPLRQLSRGAEDSGRALDRQVRSARAATAAMKLLRSAAKSAGAGLAGLVGVGGGLGLAKLAQSVGTLVDRLAGLDGALARIRAISGATGQEFELLRQKALEIGNTTELSALQAAEGMQAMLMAGQSIDEVLGGIDATLGLAAAGAIDLGQAADFATNALGAFGANVQELPRFVDALAATSTKANVSVSQLQKSLEQSGSIFGALGTPIEEVLALLGKLGDVGIQGGKAGTGLAALARALGSVQEGSGRAGKALAELGLSADQVNPALHSMTDILALLADRGITANQAFALVGSEGATALLSLTPAVAQIRELRSELDNAAGSADRMRTEGLDSLEGGLALLVSALDGAIQRLGDGGLTDAFTDATKALATFINGIQNLEQVGALLGGVVRMFQAIAPVVTAVSKALLALSPMVGNAARLGAIFAKFAHDSEQSRLGIVDMATAADQVQPSLTAAGEAGNAAAAGIDAVGSAATGAGAPLGNINSQLGGVASRTAAVDAAAERLRDRWSTALGAMDSSTAESLDAIEAHFADLDFSVVNNLAQEQKDALRPMVEEWIRTLQQAGRDIPPETQAIGGALGLLVANVGPVSDAARQAGGGIIQLGDDLVKLGQRGQQGAQQFRSGADEFDSAAGSMASARQRAEAEAQGLGAATSRGSDAISDQAASIASDAAGVETAAGQAAGSAAEQLGGVEARLAAVEGRLRALSTIPVSLPAPDLAPLLAVEEEVEQRIGAIEERFNSADLSLDLEPIDTAAWGASLDAALSAYQGFVGGVSQLSAEATSAIALVQRSAEQAAATTARLRSIVES